MSGISMKFTTQLFLPFLALSLVASYANAMQPKAEPSWAHKFANMDTSYIKYAALAAGLATAVLGADRQASTYRIEKIVDNTFYLKPSSTLAIVNTGLADGLAGSIFTAVTLLMAHFFVSESLYD